MKGRPGSSRKYKTKERHSRQPGRAGSRSGKSVKTALGGILLALTVLVLYAESLAPAGRLSLFALSSFFVSIIIMETGLKAGWLFYIGTSLLSFFIVPDKLGLLPYFMFFGLYGLIKCYAEKTKNRTGEYLLKLIFFNLNLALAYFLASALFMAQVRIKLSLWLVIPILETAFIVYDYVYSIFIQVYRDRIRKALRL
jgi:uncharacterized membrane protein